MKTPGVTRTRPEPSPDGHRRWIAAGLADLTGHPDRDGLAPPPMLVGRLDRLASLLHTRATLTVDPLGLLGQRACRRGFTRQGRTSCGGSTRLLRTIDGWLAVTLARPDDVVALAAWLRVEPSRLPASHPLSADDWDRVADLVARRSAVELEDQGVLLGLAVARLAPPGTTTVEVTDDFGVRSSTTDPTFPARPLAGARVVDLSALWAGPLCTRLLADAGAQVTTVTFPARPDAMRHGDPELYAQLAAGKSPTTIDPTTPDGRDTLLDVLHGADVVVEAARPRALHQLGVDASRVLASGPKVWLSITAHGRSGVAANRIGFGDDAAVAGGLVAYDDAGEPVFCADAIGDPITGMAAAAATARALGTPGRHLLDVAMARVAASCTAI